MKPFAAIVLALSLAGCGRQLDRLLTGGDDVYTPPPTQTYVVHNVYENNVPKFGASIYVMPATAPIVSVKVRTQDWAGNTKMFDLPAVPDGDGPAGYIRTAGSQGSKLSFWWILRDYPLAVEIEVTWRTR